jgi:hypothetical protein
MQGQYARYIPTSTCIHGMDSASCLICRTLGTTTATAATADRTTSIPTGRPEVIQGQRRARSHRIGGLGLVGWLFVIVGLAVLGWWVLGLVWAVLRIVELVAVGLLCGYVGYKIGVVAGRHKARIS